MKRKNSAGMGAGYLLVAVDVAGLMLIYLVTTASGIGGTDSAGKKENAEEKKGKTTEIEFLLAALAKQNWELILCAFFIFILPICSFIFGALLSRAPNVVFHP